jgi:FKBP-type peptidyl-prolyl cis-trans isomerase SlyD
MAPPAAEASVTDGKVVAFHYTLTNDEGEVLDSSEGRAPLAYLQGAANIVPGLERQMLGRAVGDRFTARVAPADGYGERTGAPQSVPRGAFPPEVDVQVGMQFAAQGPNGSVIPLWVVDVADDTVSVDRNHPLAGVTLNFAVEIAEIREATTEELAHGHPHGPEGHHH